MSRRRALMVEQGEDNPLVYSLENHQVSTGNVIDTGIKAFSSGMACTIMLDFTNTVNPSSGNARVYRLIEAWSDINSVEIIYVGKVDAWTNSLKLAWQEANTNGVPIPNSSPNPARHRVCITHEANSNSITVYYKRDNDDMQTITRTASVFTPEEKNIKFGTTVNSLSSLPAGTINSAKIYNIVLPLADINAFFA